MPEMLNPAESQRDLPPRYAQVSPRPSPVPQQPKGMVVRGQGSDEKPVQVLNVPAAKLVMPSPEELGLVGSQTAVGAALHDWSAARQVLDSLGATYYRLEKAAEGGFRFTCALPHASDAGRQRNFECHAASEGEAIRLALHQVEAWQSFAPRQPSE